MKFLRIRNTKDAGNQTWSRCDHCGTLFAQDPDFTSAYCTPCWAVGATIRGTRVCPWPTHRECGERAADEQRRKYANDRRAQRGGSLF